MSTRKRIAHLWSLRAEEGNEALTFGEETRGPVAHLMGPDDLSTSPLWSQPAGNGAKLSSPPWAHLEYHAEAPTRSSQLFEYVGPVVLPLSLTEDFLAKRINFLKKWYILIHLAYILSLAIIGSLFFFSLESNLEYIDAFFIAMSSVCCCGLQTVDGSGWRVSSNLLRHFLMIGGGVVFTSAHQPLLRIWMLKKMCPLFEQNPSDSFSEGRLRASRRKHAERLLNTSIICLVTPLLYFAIVHVFLMFFLGVCNRSNLNILEVFELIVASFHGSIFLSMEQYVRDPAVVLMCTIGCALGFTLFPVVLRDFFYAEWFAYRFVRHVYMRYIQSCRSNNQSSFLSPTRERLALLDDTPPNDVDSLFHGSEDTTIDDAVVHLSSWDRGFRDILTSRQPVSFHAFLFLRNETIYLGVAWCVITLVQAVPFWLQQWSGGNALLAPFSTPYKVFLSLCQAAVVRFAAASFVSCLEYNNAHIAITIFFMFLPALPIPTDRTYRKWKQVFRTSVVRLLTSRLFFLFIAMVSILFAEEGWLTQKLSGSRFDAMTRSLFEVISAFAGCGLSLSLKGTEVSFVGSLGTFSKLVIAAVMLAGRHRTVDLGIDLGFAGLRDNQENFMH